MWRNNKANLNLRDPSLAVVGFVDSVGLGSDGAAAASLMTGAGEDEINHSHAAARYLSGESLAGSTVPPSVMQSYAGGAQSMLRNEEVTEVGHRPYWQMDERKNGADILKLQQRATRSYVDVDYFIEESEFLLI